LAQACPKTIMRAAVISVVGASVSFFVPGVDVRPAGQPAAVLQPQVQMQPHLQPQQWSDQIPVVAIPSARSAGNDNASARWFGYGLFGALCAMALRSKAFALSFPSVRKAALRRPAARFPELRMSAAALAEAPTRTGPGRYWPEGFATQTAGADADLAPARTGPGRYWPEGFAIQTAGADADLVKVDPAWELAREAIAFRTRKMDPREEDVFTETQISDAMKNLPRVWKKRADGMWEDAQTDEEKRARAVEVLREASAMDAADKPAGARYGGPKAFVSGQQASAKDAAYTLSPAERPTTAAERRARYGGSRAFVSGKPEPVKKDWYAGSKVASSAAPMSAVSGVVVPTTPLPKPTAEKASKKEKKETRAAWQEGIFAPAVIGAKKVMGEQQLKEFRASVIAKHSKVIGNFVDTSESKFGQLVLKRMFDYADKDGNGTLDKEEVRSALLDLGFDFLDEKSVEKLIKNADKDQNDVIDFEEFVQATPKALRINLVKLAKKNGHDLGFLV